MVRVAFRDEPEEEASSGASSGDLARSFSILNNIAAAFSAISAAAATAGGLIGFDQFAAGLASRLTRLDRGARRADGASVEDILNAMRARVPRDTGELLNGIQSRPYPGGWIISAEGFNPRDGADYAPWVEYGTSGGERGVTRSTFGSSGDVSQRRSYRNHPGTEAQPFFWPSVREGQESRSSALEGVVDGFSQEV